MAAPAARTEVVRDTYFGVTVEDPYRWLEDTASDEVGAWLEGQAAHARSVLDGLGPRSALLARVAELRGHGPTRSGFAAAGGAVFHLRQDAGADVPALVVRGPGDGPERVLLDPGAMAGATHRAIDWYVPSPDGRHVACGVSKGGSERSTLHLVETATGRLLDDTLPGALFPFVSWLEEGGSFPSLIYHHHPDPPEDAPPGERRLDSRSLLHRLGTDATDDVVVLARGLNPRVPMTRLDRPFLVVSPRGGWLLAIVSHAALGGRTTDEELTDCTLYVAPRGELADPARCPWRRAAGVEDAVVAYALTEQALHLVSGRDAPRYQVLAVPLADPDLDRARVVVPPGPRVVEAVKAVGDHLLVRDLDAGVARLRRVALGGGEPEDLALPVQGAILEWAEGPNRGEVLLRLASWTAAPRLYRCRVASGELEDTGWAPPAAADLDGVEERRVEATARDGTPIPLSIVHPTGLRRDGGNPTLLEAYGSYGFALRPEFIPEMRAWYERGGVYAVAHVRGGGEHGREWHQAGRGPAKETTITDMIDCAEHLIAQGYTRPERLAGKGVSAGGIAAGGALVRRPELWAAMVLQVPLTNTLRAEFGENGRINVPEFGSVTTEEGLAGLLVMDAYLRVRDGVAYPAVLLTAGLNDPRVEVWQPAKLAARLQAASTSGRPVLLRIDPEAGHGFGSTAAQQDRLLADELAFLLEALQVAVAPRW
ncbi:MAG TPA: prolyl oligopeptidase family serine peptidase [Actinomycetota bacterium]|jgi:prolyl oligopeptidase|nr:prolyl oligopeptidase family serine peptidase [Actinomycetota bacterium]